ncbi:MAG TPA: hypothetical protein VLA36_12125 [Longimicrobiales bacterium]|nr:hypothetical protein [Longimicrobiales bacterium]
MAGSGGPVYAAIERWEEKSLVTRELGARLRQEVAATSAAGTVRVSQYVVAATGAVVLLIAAGVFLDWAWPLMGEGARSGVLVVVGLLVHVFGVRFEVRHRWVPAALFMQTAALGLLVTAAFYSKLAWPDVSAGGVAVGIASLAVPLALAPRTLRRNVVMPAIHLCAALAFVTAFLDRATPLSSDAIVWTLDGVLVVASAVMVALLREDPAGERHPWVLNAFVSALYAGAVLVVLTADGPLGMQNRVVYPLDAWWLLVVLLTLWGIHRAPHGLRRNWFGDQLAYSVLLWIPLGFMTTLEAMNQAPWTAMVAVGGVGVAGFAYGVLHRTRKVLFTGALAFVLGVWYWAAEIGGALGVVAGLVFAAGLLFWISGRVSGWMSRTLPTGQG